MTRRVGTTHCEMEALEGRRPSWGHYQGGARAGVILV